MSETRCQLLIIPPHLHIWEPLPLWFERRIPLSATDIAQSLLVSQLVMEWKGQPLSRQNDRRLSAGRANQSVPWGWSDSAAQKPLLVPASCHGDGVWALNTSLHPLPASQFSSPSHSSRICPGFFLTVSSLTRSRSASQSCFLRPCWVFRSPSITLPRPLLRNDTLLAVPSC